MFKQVCIRKSSDSSELIDTPEKVIKAMRKSNYDNQYYYSCSTEVMKKALNAEFDDVRNGVLGGCYGARDGKQYEGFTVYVPYTDLTDRWIDEDGDEIVNIAKVLIDTCIEWQKVKNIDTTSIVGSLDNSYNWHNECSDRVYLSQTINYNVIETAQNQALVFIEFHGGGDVRGNYSSPYLFVFDSINDFYECVFSPAYLIDLAQ